MLADAITAITAIIGAMGDFLTPTASEGGLTAAAVTAIATLFAIPIAVKAGKKAFGLLRRV